MQKSKSLIQHKRIGIIRFKYLRTTTKLTDKEVKYLINRAKEGNQIAELVYGFYLYFELNNHEQAFRWWNKFYRHACGSALWLAFEDFRMQGDEFYEWAYKCLKKSASKKFAIAQVIYKRCLDDVFKFQEA